MSTEKKIPALAAAAGLAVAAAVHVAWAAGTSWPAATRQGLADLVVGDGRPFPSAPLTLAVAGALTVAAAIVAERGWRVQPLLRAERASRVACGVIVAALLVRGVGGLVVSTLDLVGATEQFRLWDAVLYSPLCVILGLGAASVIRRRPSAE